jgi:hypothetical protein
MGKNKFDIFFRHVTPSPLRSQQKNKIQFRFTCKKDRNERECFLNLYFFFVWTKGHFYYHN